MKEIIQLVDSYIYIYIYNTFKQESDLPPPPASCSSFLSITPAINSFSSPAGEDDIAADIIRKAVAAAIIVPEAFER